MKRISIALAVAACAGTPATTPAPPLRPVPPPPQPQAFVFRQVHVRTGGTTRTTFELAIDGDRVTLVETDERADGSAWTRQASHTYRGTHRGGDVELAADDQQPLALHCESRAIQVAGPQPGDCSPTPGSIRVDAFVCVAPGQSAGDADADDELVFASPPGVEWRDAACGGGLRQVAP